MKTKTTAVRLLGFGLVALMAMPQTAAADDPPAPLDQQFDRYWAKRREVKNIHKRLFLKDGRHEFTIFGGVIPNDDFFSYYPLGLRYNYYFTEDFALEVAGAYLFKKKSKLEEFLEEDVIQGLEVELPQFLEWQAGAGVLWTPLHGKVAIFNTKLGHFDFGFALGVMALGTQLRKEGADSAEPRVDVGGNVGATVRFYLLDFLALRFDYRHYFYAARNADDENRGLSFPAELSFGVSFFTSAPK